MGIKRRVRTLLEKVVEKYGYTMAKEEPNIHQYDLVADQKKVPFDRAAFEKRDKDSIVVSWVIPPLGPGSGGHLDIFRAIDLLSGMGLKHRVYIYGGNEGIPSSDLKKTVKEYYGIYLGQNEIYANVRKMRYTDAIVATSWITAYIVRNFDNAVSKFYFVQDFEPYFYPMGSEYCFAENTYKFGFRGITAGDWLAQKLREEYGMETQAFSFSYERELYHPGEKKDDVNRVFFYARPYTERRAFEMGVLALEKLAEEIPDLEVIFAGQKLIGYEFKFQYKDMGIMRLDELSDMYAQCDLCLVLSMTNLSLLPMEIMASNSVVVSNRGPNNEWLCSEENSVMVETDPIDIAEKMKYYLTHKQELASKREKGRSYVETLTWEKELRKVYDFIVASVSSDLEKMEEQQELKK